MLSRFIESTTDWTNLVARSMGAWMPPPKAQGSSWLRERGGRGKKMNKVPLQTVLYCSVGARRAGLVPGRQGRVHTQLRDAWKMRRKRTSLKTGIIMSLNYRMKHTLFLTHSCSVQLR